MPTRTATHPIEFQVDAALEEALIKHGTLGEKEIYAAYMKAMQKWFQANGDFIKELILDYWHGPSATIDEAKFIDGLALSLKNNLNNEFVPWRRPGTKPS